MQLVSNKRIQFFHCENVPEKAINKVVSCICTLEEYERIMYISL